MSKLEVVNSGAAENAAKRAEQAQKAASMAREHLKDVEKLINKERTKYVAEKKAAKKSAVNKAKKNSAKKKQ